VNRLEYKNKIKPSKMLRTIENLCKNSGAMVVERKNTTDFMSGYNDRTTGKNMYS